MKTFKRKVLKAQALVLVLSTFILYAMPCALLPVASAQNTQATGILSTTNNRNILVNKSDMGTGATIVDGATLETSDCIGASVRLWPVGAEQNEANAIGRVELSKNTTALVSYSADKITVTLTRGCAILHAGANVSGLIVTPDGRSTAAARPEGSNGKSAEVCYPANSRPDYLPHCLAVPPLVFILGSAAGAAAVAAAVAGVSSRGENPSPNAP